MIIRSKAPLRLGLAGGGTDVSPYSDMYGGLVLNATINLYAYCTIEELPDCDYIEIDSYDADVHERYALAESLEIDGKASLIKGVYNRLMKDFSLPLVGFRINTYNDAPAGSGLGTSSILASTVLGALNDFCGLAWDKQEIGRRA